MEYAEPFRESMITSIMERAGRNGGFVTRADLVFRLPDGKEIALVDRTRGIRNPTSMEATITVMSSADGPYADRDVAGGLFHYAYRKGSTNGDNAKLRRAYELGLPIVLLRKTRESEFVPFAPVCVVEDLVEQREFLLALDESVRFLGQGNPDAPERRYAERVVKQRLHQAEFRGRVIAAYQTRCAICRLRHGELLDAAHITPDREDAGLPAVSNGLALCKIHHAAFDMNMLGISPDYVVKVDKKLLDEVDGPMLRHGLQEMHGTALTVPTRRGDRPDKTRLEQRFAAFLQKVS